MNKNHAKWRDFVIENVAYLYELVDLEILKHTQPKRKSELLEYEQQAHLRRINKIAKEMK